MASSDDEALALVHEGWHHLKVQRPLAAWAAWQRALRLKPGDPAASQALAYWATAHDLPAAARATYRFRTPRDERRRARWDARFHDRDMGDLEVAAAAFADLAKIDPEDAPAWFNWGLCLAWQGQNASAISALDRAVRLDAAEHFDAAVEAWMLAEVLRQGAGAEGLADDLSHSLTLPWRATDGDPVAWLSSFAILRALPAPIDPVSDQPSHPGARLFEWLDRPLPEPSAPLMVDDLPRVRASVIITNESLRCSSPSVPLMIEVERDLLSALGDEERPLDRRSTPLPLALMDAAVWLVRLPDGLDESARQNLLREAVERYYEDDWIFAPRHGLAGPDDSQAVASPIEVYRRLRDLQGEAGGRAAVLRAKLEAVIRVREQLAARPHVRGLYGGYPFDRLRRRLGLEPIDPAAVDPADVSCMSADELERLEVASLDEARLVEAYRSARAVCDPWTTGRLAKVLAERSPSALVRVDPPRLAERVVFATFDQEGLARALEWLDRAIALDQQISGGRHRGRFELWRGHLLGRSGQRAEAAAQLRSLLDRFPDDADLLYEAAASLMDWDQAPLARPLLQRVIELAQGSGDRPKEHAARRRLTSMDGQKSK
ncbi:MAG: hypothetical protein IRY99_04200 [Isosphaeraceae bacterium]|nr:hypothetical protein [Isosphaeraceae bacterium]